MQNDTSDRNALLFEAVLALKDQEECRAFFQDLCTVSELRAMAQRLEVAQLLDQGHVYNYLPQRTGRARATLSRGYQGNQNAVEHSKCVLAWLPRRLGRVRRLQRGPPRPRDT